MDDQPPQPEVAVDELVTLLLDAIAPGRTRRHVAELIESTISLAKADTDPLNLKIAAAALREMRDAFAMFRPYTHERKVAIFGSARTRQDDPLYAAARAVAEELAAGGWMVITGAGPGIMQAGMEGAGRERSIGVSIRLPWEQGANPVIAGDTKYVSMKYFFTRKLMLIKEAKGFVCLPGGFGTLDETFELLTLTQTGKGVPVPIVFLDTPGDPYWEAIAAMITDQLVSRGARQPERHRALLRHRRSSRRGTRDQPLLPQLRLAAVRRRPARDPAAHATDGRTDGAAERPVRFPLRARPDRAHGPLPIEVRDDDAVDLARITFVFAKHGFGELRRLIDTVNGFVEAD